MPVKRLNPVDAVVADAYQRVRDNLIYKDYLIGPRETVPMSESQRAIAVRIHPYGTGLHDFERAYAAIGVTRLLALVLGATDYVSEMGPVAFVVGTDSVSFQSMMLYSLEDDREVAHFQDWCSLPLVFLPEHGASHFVLSDLSDEYSVVYGPLEFLSSLCEGRISDATDEFDAFAVNRNWLSDLNKWVHVSPTGD